MLLYVIAAGCPLQSQHHITQPEHEGNQTPSAAAVASLAHSLLKGMPKSYRNPTKPISTLSAFQKEKEPHTLDIPGFA